MPEHWTRKVPGAPWVLQAKHGTWVVAEEGKEGTAELRYASLDCGGRLPTVPLPLGEFGSVSEAMLAVDLYEAEPTPMVSEDYVQALLPGLDGELGLQAPGRVRFLLGRSREGVWLAIGRSRTVAEVVATLRAPGHGEAGGGAHMRPPGHEDPTELDIRIMAEIFELRRARASGSAEAPVREDEYRGWRDRTPGLPVVRAPGSQSSTCPPVARS